LLTLDEAEFNRRLEECQNNYYIEYVVLNCIRLIADSTPIDFLIDHEIIKNITVEGDKPPVYVIDTCNGRFKIQILSDGFRWLNLWLSTQFWQGKCHTSAFEIFSRAGSDLRLVTAQVSVLADQHTYLHSWVECDRNNLAYDMSMGAALSISVFRQLMHAQKPLIEIHKSELSSREISRKEWLDMVDGLYE
jgi:hypothetical protein